MSEIRQRLGVERFRRCARVVASAGLGLLACPGGDAGRVPPSDAPAPPPPGVEFASHTELLEAIASGRFTERAGLGEAIEAATPEPVPPPVAIEFVSGTAVPDDQQDELAELAALLRENERLRVDITGCSDPSGGAALNQRISEGRARSVAARIGELGVGPEQIGDVVGKGEDCPVQERVVHAVPALREPEPDPEGEGTAGASEG